MCVYLCVCVCVVCDVCGVYFCVVDDKRVHLLPVPASFVCKKQSDFTPMLPVCVGMYAYMCVLIDARKH